MYKEDGENMNKKVLIVIFLILGITLVAQIIHSKAYFRNDQTLHHAFIEDDYYDEYEKACYNFIKDKMVSNRGGIFTNYLDSGDISEYATGHQILSESQGLYMLYLIQKNDKEGFDNSFKFIKQNMIKGDGTILWRVHERYKDIAGGNAVVDDLRIIRALVNASEKWKDNTYTENLKKLEEKLFKFNTDGKYLYDYYDYAHKVITQSMPLCYYDLKTIQMLGQYRKEWLEIGAKSVDIIEKGYLGNEFPFYRMRYDYNTRKYSQDESINMTENILTVLHLAEVGMHKEETINWLKNQLKQGGIYGSYDRNGVMLSNVESTAIYATIAQIGKTIGDMELYTLAIEHMLRFQISDSNSTLKGAFGNEQTEEVYSYDNLQALLAF